MLKSSVINNSEYTYQGEGKDWKWDKSHLETKVLQSKESVELTYIKYHKLKNIKADIIS